MISPTGVRQGHAAARGCLYTIGPRITHIDRAIIRAYFRQLDGTATAAQEGRRKYQPELRGRWPVANRLTPQLQTTWLPDELEQKLSALATGYQRVRAGSDVLLIETANRTVIDVLQDIHTTI